MKCACSRPRFEERAASPRRQPGPDRGRGAPLARAGLRARLALPRLPHRQRLPLLRPRRPRHGPGLRRVQRRLARLAAAEALPGARVLGERRPRLGPLRPRRPLQHGRARHDRQPADRRRLALQVPRARPRIASARTTGSRSSRRATSTSASDWEGERCFLWAEGTVRQEIVYGENLLLTRRYEAEVGRSSFTLRDVVRNDGFYPTPHQLLYHFNIGYPVVDDGAELLASVTGDVPGSIFEDDAGPSERYRQFSGPGEGVLRRGLRDPDGDRTATAGSRPRSSTAASRGSTAGSASTSATTRRRCRSTSSGG